jgi:hypothetical protein
MTPLEPWLQPYGKFVVLDVAHTLSGLLTRVSELVGGASIDMFSLPVMRDLDFLRLHSS